MKIKFEYELKDNWLEIVVESPYEDLGMVSNRGWTSEIAQMAIEDTLKVKNGDFKDDETGDDYFFFGIGDYVTGDILVHPLGVTVYMNKGGEEIPQFTLTFDQLIDFLTQMRDYLQSVGI
ncbi:MAG: hypothetical protein H6581_30225 [Bacteroidia bacterium]|nr:hypothetical protein [Bacteroidia bacterium]